MRVAPGRSAITGAGCVTPIGIGVDEFVSGWHRGDLGITQPTWAASAPIPVLAAPVSERFDPIPIIGERIAASTDRATQFALVASEEAIVQAGLHEPGALHPTRTAVINGTAGGGFYTLMHAQHCFDTGGIDGIPRKAMLAAQPNMAAAQIAIRHELHGPLQTITTACASSLDALGAGAALLDSGRVDVALCGGSEGMAAPDERFVPVFSIAGRIIGMETPAVDPQRAVLPFDVDRKGVLFGEGSAWFVLEAAEHAQHREVQPLAWVLGVGSCSDGHHPVSPEPSGQWQAHAMELALADAGIDAAQVDVVIAHATGTPKGDLTEARSLERVFSGCATPPPVTALKGHTAHTGGSSGAMSVLAALEVLRTGLVPPVRGTRKVDPAVNVDVVVGDPRVVDAKVVMVNAFGFGGQNACIVLGSAGHGPDRERGPG